MSDAARSGRVKFALPNKLAFLSEIGRAGPRRLMLISLGVLALVALLVGVTMSGRRAPPFSRDARMTSVDPLPGGLHSTPEQDALAVKADTTHAEAALNAGNSYTPPIAPSVPVGGQPPLPEQARPQSAPPPRPHFVTRPQPAVVPAAVAFPPPAEPGEAPAPASRPIQTVAAADSQQEAAVKKQIGDLFSQWGGRAPLTDVILPPRQTPDGTAANGGNTPSTDGPATGGRLASTPVAASFHPAGEVLIPAGRGVFAHTVLASSSDQPGPVVLQADTGPIASDRMIGNFARQNDRLVVNVNSINHHGSPLPCDGVVIAPDTMETAVASGVDQHYLTRFILPAAAAFVQGLGQALATTSNSIAVLSPFGGATTATHLNFHQQLGVAAGVAAGQIGAALSQAAPKGATVTLDANVSVGVIFLSDVKLEAQR